MSQGIMSYWVGFASGDINSLNPPVQWQPFTPTSQSQLEINPNFRMKQWDVDTCNFWDSLGYRF